MILSLASRSSNYSHLLGHGLSRSVHPCIQMISSCSCTQVNKTSVSCAPSSIYLSRLLDFTPMCRSASSRRSDEKRKILPQWLVFSPASFKDFREYLGMPLSVTKLPKSELQPLVDAMANRLPTWKVRLLNHVE